MAAARGRQGSGRGGASWMRQVVGVFSQPAALSVVQPMASQESTVEAAEMPKVIWHLDTASSQEMPNFDMIFSMSVFCGRGRNA